MKTAINIDAFKTFLHPYFASEASKRFGGFKSDLIVILWAVLCFIHQTFSMSDDRSVWHQTSWC